MFGIKREEYLKLSKGSVSALKKLLSKDYGFIYVLKSFGYYKIGYTGNFKQRLGQYNSANPQFEVIYQRKVIYPFRLEQKLLHIFASRHHKGEWFILSDGDVGYLMQMLKMWEDFSKEYEKKPSKT